MERRIRSQTQRIVFALITVAAFSQPLVANFNYQLNISSSYIWRGFDLNPTQKMVLQPSMDFSFGKSGLALNLWGSFSFVNRETNSFENNTSHELFITAGLPNMITHPSLTVFYDFTNGDGFYFQLETDHSITITPSIQTELSASLGYNGGQWLAEGVDPGFSDLNIGMAVSLECKDWIITPYANYTFVLLDALGNDNFFWFGISVGYSKASSNTPN
jgi:hypothetical protein